MEESEGIHTRVAGFYRTRSKIVHSGKTDSLQRNDVAELRELCRVALKRLVEAGMDKDELMAVLNKRDYESPITPEEP